VVRQRISRSNNASEGCWLLAVAVNQTMMLQRHWKTNGVTPLDWSCSSDHQWQAFSLLRSTRGSLFIHL